MRGEKMKRIGTYLLTVLIITIFIPTVIVKTVNFAPKLNSVEGKGFEDKKNTCYSKRK